MSCYQNREEGWGLRSQSSTGFSTGRDVLTDLVQTHTTSSNVIKFAIKSSMIVSSLKWGQDKQTCKAVGEGVNNAARRLFQRNATNNKGSRIIPCVDFVASIAVLFLCFTVHGWQLPSNACRLPSRWTSWSPCRLCRYPDGDLIMFLYSVVD